jgi:hypothetical protein
LLTIPFKSNPLCYFHEHARDVLNHPVGTTEFSTLFEMNEHTVRCNLLQGRQEPEPLDRHNALDAQLEAALVAILLDVFQARQPMSKK